MRGSWQRVSDTIQLARWGVCVFTSCHESVIHHLLACWACCLMVATRHRHACDCGLQTEHADVSVDCTASTAELEEQVRRGSRLICDPVSLFEREFMFCACYCSGCPQEFQSCNVKRCIYKDSLEHLYPNYKSSNFDQAQMCFLFNRTAQISHDEHMWRYVCIW